MNSMNSSTISNVVYDVSRLLLYIQFRSGRVYEFTHVPRKVYSNLISSPSQGRYYKDYIEGKYPFRPIE